MSERRRWQPPPMEPTNGGADAKVKLDEKVVRKVLATNPSLRGGRTTSQVKKDLERGAAVRVQAQQQTVTASAAAAPPPRGELDETLGFFIRSKADRLAAALEAVASRRKALNEEEAALKRELREQLASFVAMLDEQTVALHGATALSKHRELLAKLEWSPAALLEAARKGRR